MISGTDSAYKEIHNFISSHSTIKGIYNASQLISTPNHTPRIEFRLANFVSTGHVRNEYIANDDTMVFNNVSEYRCQLLIKVIGNGNEIYENTANITGAIQNQYTQDLFFKELYILNETIAVQDIPFVSNGVFSLIPEIRIDCVIAISHSVKGDYFDKVEDTKIKITEV